MTVQASDDVHVAALNVVESTIGTEPIMKLFSGALPANCAAADPSGLLCTLVLPADWLAGAFGIEKEQNGGPWVGIATATGNIASFRLYSSGGTCHMQGTVGTRTTVGADLKLLNTLVWIGQKVKISKFRLFNVLLTVAHPVIGGTLNKTQDANTLVGRGTAPITVPEPPATVTGGRLVLVDDPSLVLHTASGAPAPSEGASDAPTWYHACARLYVPWKRGTEVGPYNTGQLSLPCGGDWLDLNGTGNGATPHATIPVSALGGTTSAKPNGTTVTIGGAGHAGMKRLAERLIEDNCGIFIHAIGNPRAGPAPHFVAKEHSTLSAFKAALTIVNTVGTSFSCPLLADSYLEPNVSWRASMGASQTFRTPGMLKFDVSGVTGTVSHATLTIQHTAHHAGLNLAVDYLDLPVLLNDPAVQLPDRIEQGIAWDVAKHTDLYDHSSVWNYGNFTSPTTAASSFNAANLPTSDTTKYSVDAATGISVIRINNPQAITPGQNTLFNSDMQNLLYPIAGRTYPGQRTSTAKEGYELDEAPEEWYFGYYVMFEQSFLDGIWQGNKCPGLVGNMGGGNSFYSSTVFPSTDQIGWDYEWGFATHVEVASDIYNCAAIANYMYDADNVFTNPNRGRTQTAGACVKPDKYYWVEMRVKMNTLTPSGPQSPDFVATGNRDGIFELWLDGVKVFSKTDMQYRVKHRAQILGVDGLFMHGGNYGASNIQFCKTGGWVISSQYIGPPRQIPVWRRGLATNTFHSVNGTAAMSGVTSTSATINTWNGLAASDLKLFAALNGGHQDSAENKVYELDLYDDAPAWVKLHDGTTNASSQAFDIAHYTGGLPASRHTYYTLQYVKNLNSVLAVTGYALWGTGGASTTNVDVFRLSSNTWHAADTFMDSPFVAYNGVTAVCSDYRDGRIYVAGSFNNTNHFYKFNPNGLTGQRLGVWTSVISGPAAVGLGEWQYHGTCIDVDQNRWVCLYSVGPSLRWVALDGTSSGTIAITGQLATDGVPGYSQIVYDEDNDRYVAMTGTGKCYAISTTGVSTLLTTTTAAAVGAVCGRFSYFPKLGGIAYQPSFASPLLFMPTR